MLFALALLDIEASNAFRKLTEHSYTASSCVAIVHRVGCNSRSLFGIFDCLLLAHTTVMMMAVGVDGGLYTIFFIVKVVIGGGGEGWRGGRGDGRRLFCIFIALTKHVNQGREDVD
jgi:hypothetical protein